MRRAALAALASTVPILHALWVDPWWWGLLRGVTGVCLVGLYIVPFGLLPLTLTPVVEPEPLPAHRLGLRALYRLSSLGLAGAQYGLGAVFVQRLGRGDATAAAVLGGALFQWPIGSLDCSRTQSSRRSTVMGIITRRYCGGR